MIPRPFETKHGTAECIIHDRTETVNLPRYYLSFELNYHPYCGLTSGSAARRKLYDGNKLEQICAFQDFASSNRNDAILCLTYLAILG